MNSKYSKHLLKYCSKHGLDTEYNKIHDEYKKEVLEVIEPKLKRLRAEANDKAISIGTRYTALLQEEMKTTGLELQSIRDQIALLKKKQQELDSAIDKRHRHYQSLTKHEVMVIQSEFISTRDFVFKEIDERYDAKLRDTFGDV